MRKQPWTCAGEHPVPSWLGGDGKTCVGIFCASRHPGARSRSDKSWCGSGNVGAFPAGLVVQRHSRRAGAGSAPGPQPGVAMSPGTFSTAQVSTGTATATGCGGGSAGSCHRVPRASHDRTLPAPCDCRPCRDGRFYPMLPGLVGGTGAVPAPPGSLLSPRCDLRDGDMRTQSLQSL